MPRDRIVFFPVGNGSMTLIQVDGKSVLFDINILGGSDQNGGYEVVDDLYCALAKYEMKEGHPVVDVFIQSHADNDHIQGFQKYFFEEDDPVNLTAHDTDDARKKIFIREIWCSERFRKYASENYSMGDDAKAFRREVKRRLAKFNEGDISDGNRVKILGDHLDVDDGDVIPDGVRVGVGRAFIVGRTRNLSAEILGPIKRQTENSEDEYNESEEDYTESKNRGSLVIRFAMTKAKSLLLRRTMHILIGGDAEWFVWKTLNRNVLWTRLEYDLLLAPHHASWRAFSGMPATKDGYPKADEGARRALSRSKSMENSFVVVSAKAKEKERDDEKSTGRKFAIAEYERFVGKCHVYNPNELPSSDAPQPLVFKFTEFGLQKLQTRFTPPPGAV